MTLKASLLLYAVLCCQVADWGTTVVALSMGATEANPLMRPLFDISPYLALVPKLLAVGIITLGYLAVDKQDRKLANWVILWYLLISAFPVVWNLIQLARAGLI